MDKPKPNPWLKLALELGPLVIFFLANSRYGIFNATAIFMVAIFASLAVSWILTRHLPIMAIVTAVLVLIFGTLTLVLHDDTFIKIKPTIIYAMFGAVLAGGLLFGRSLISILFDQVFRLTPEGWRILSIRWAIFFFAMAALNEIVWRTQTLDFWVGFKAFGVVPLTLLFGLTQYPVLTKHQMPDDDKPAS
jgi:intracellular septation protein